MFDIILKIVIFCVLSLILVVVCILNIFSNFSSSSQRAAVKVVRYHSECEDQLLHHARKQPPLHLIPRIWDKASEGLIPTN